MRKEIIKVQVKGGCERSYCGTWLKSSEIELEVYDKNCGSPSCLCIRLEEVSEKGRRNVISKTLHRTDLLKLKEILNSVEL